MLKKYLARHRKFLFALGIGTTFFDIIFLPATNSPVLLVILAYWLFLGFYYKISEKAFFILALISLVFSIPFFLFNNIVYAERFSVWQFLFLCLALGQFAFLEVWQKFSRKKTA